MAIRLKKTDGGRQSSGYTCESKDCTVRSFACAADVSYDVAHEVAKRSGRKNGKGWWTEKILAVAKQDDLVEFIQVPAGVHVNLVYGTPRYSTIEQITRRYPKGRYIISTCNHSLALIDGEIHDTGIRPRARVVSIWEIRLKEKPKAAITQNQINDLWARLDRLEAK